MELMVKTLIFPMNGYNRYIEFIFHQHYYLGVLDMTGFGAQTYWQIHLVSSANPLNEPGRKTIDQFTYENSSHVLEKPP